MGWTVRGSNSGRYKIILSSPKRLYLLWDPTSPLIQWISWFFPRSKRPEREVEQSHLVPSLGMSGDFSLLPGIGS